MRHSTKTGPNPHDYLLGAMEPKKGRPSQMKGGLDPFDPFALWPRFAAFETSRRCREST
jgi:hypothetical protein